MQLTTYPYLVHNRDGVIKIFDSKDLKDALKQYLDYIGYYRIDGDIMSKMFEGFTDNDSGLVYLVNELISSDNELHVIDHVSVMYQMIYEG